MAIDGPGSPSTQRDLADGASLFEAAWSGLCPCCGSPSLFCAPARIADRCRVCGLSFGELERGGRFAGLLTLAIAAVLCSVAIGIDTVFEPPLWLQLFLWAPMTIGTVLYGLRLFKTALLFRQYSIQQAAESKSE
ncbi:MAG: DUF983 domain-containing protein [Pseudomonadota bacterium]